ncbi:arylsulfotransferase family protein [Jongsikchunia kroppenstedtii]|uniref:arylsulfotransferase family protein n=1 Tax=Jongsikchunia kroppenstedtii TaxID=1121721 RepID=UPI00036CE3A6|nr:arylsulfotransferase family protein [Jongsikchunia kroppenstedtii]
MKRVIPISIAVSAVVATLGAAAAVASPMLPTLPVGALSYTVNVNSPTGAPGDVFYTTGMSAAAVLPNIPLPAAQPSNVIATKTGQAIWRYTPPNGQGVSNFRTQTYQGRKVLTWWQGTSVGGHGTGEDVISDGRRIIRTLTPGDGLTSDVHEFRLVSGGRALITSYRPVTADLRSIGGPANGTMYDCIASVVDVASGRVISRWDARQHVPITDTESAKTPGDAAFDPFHMNSIALDPAGNLIISMRNTSAVYDVNPSTGVINWQLGGKHPTLRADAGVEFAFQHDAEFVGPNEITLFNDNSSGADTRGLSSAEAIHIDAAHHHATLVHNFTHPAGLVSFAMGNVQTLPNGDEFVGWGMAPHISEFDRAGRLVYDASLPLGSYRAFLDTWP